jgi:hypothetical protein
LTYPDPATMPRERSASGESRWVVNC